MSNIKKHPFLFIFVLGIELIGFSGILVGIEEMMPEYSLLTAAIGFTGLTGAFISICIGLVGAIISAIVRYSKRAKTHDGTLSVYGSQLPYTQAHIRQSAIDYMYHSKSGAVYVILTILLSPLTPVLLVYIFDLFTAGLIFITLGISIWRIGTGFDTLERKFYKKRNVDKFIVIESGENDKLLDELYAENVYVFRAKFWEDKKRFIYNLALREGALSGTTLRCYSLSLDYLCRKENYSYASLASADCESLLLIPLSQFNLTEKNAQRLITNFSRAAFMEFFQLVNEKYGRKTDISPSQFTHTCAGLMLRPYPATICRTVQEGSDLYLYFKGAVNPVDAISTFHDCLFVIRDTVFTSDESRAVIANLTSGKIDWLLGSVHINSDEKQLELTFIGDTEDECWDDKEEEYEEDEYDDSDGSVCATLGFDSIEWRWNEMRSRDKARELVMKLS